MSDKILNGCPLCDKEGVVVVFPYESLLNEVTVDAETFLCEPCQMSWMSNKQERQIDRAVAKAMREKVARLQNALDHTFMKQHSIICDQITIYDNEYVFCPGNDCSCHVKIAKEVLGE